MTRTYAGVSDLRALVASARARVTAITNILPPGKWWWVGIIAKRGFLGVFRYGGPQNAWATSPWQ
jgi:hypothetical protein